MPDLNGYPLQPLAKAGGYLYFIDAESNIKAVAVDGRSGVQILARNQVAARSVVSNGSHVYWSMPNEKVIRRVPALKLPADSGN